MNSIEYQLSFLKKVIEEKGNVYNPHTYNNKTIKELIIEFLPLTKLLDFAVTVDVAKINLLAITVIANFYSGDAKIIKTFATECFPNAFEFTVSFLTIYIKESHTGGIQSLSPPSKDSFEGLLIKQKLGHSEPSEQQLVEQIVSKSCFALSNILCDVFVHSQCVDISLMQLLCDLITIAPNSGIKNEAIYALTLCFTESAPEFLQNLVAQASPDDLKQLVQFITEELCKHLQQLQIAYDAVPLMIDTLGILIQLDTVNEGRLGAREVWCQQHGDSLLAIHSDENANEKVR